MSLDVDDKANGPVRPILIIDKNPDCLKAIRHSLAKYSGEFPEVIEVTSAADAFKVIEQKTPLCCLLSYQSPGTEEALFIEELRTLYAADQLPIIVYSLPENEESVLELLQHGAQDYLLRPEMTPARLYGSLCNAIQSSRLQQQLQYLAHYDALTGLINRNLLMNRLDLALKRCDRYQLRCALLCLNLDNFKAINDAYGHATGDLLLQAVADRIRKKCRVTDSPARFGGDEFVVLLEQVDSDTGARVAEKIMRELALPFDVNGQQLNIGASLGVAVYPDTANNAAELLKQADQALNQSKKDEMHPIVHFSAHYKKEWSRLHTLERELPMAIANNKLSLVYHPIVDAQTFELKRLEVLTRWPREDYGVPALELMEIIDRLNLTEAFHEWLFHTAFSQMRTWHEEAVHPDLCLNIPANYCYSSVIANSIKRALDRSQLSPEKIELEITESTLMRYPDRSIKVLQSLHDDGFRIAIDDFGTGYSSMAYLTRLPLDTLKIDRGFFLADQKKDRNRKVIDAIAALGHSLGLEIIAEGVETEVQLHLARAVGCDLLQGYYFGRPADPGANWGEYIANFEHISSGAIQSPKGRKE